MWICWDINVSISITRCLLEISAEGGWLVSMKQCLFNFSSTVTRCFHGCKMPKIELTKLEPQLTTAKCDYRKFAMCEETLPTHLSQENERHLLKCPNFFSKWWQLAKYFCLDVFLFQPNIFYAVFVPCSMRDLSDLHLPPPVKQLLQRTMQIPLCTCVPAGPRDTSTWITASVHI